MSLAGTEENMIDLLVPHYVLMSCDLTPQQKYLYILFYNFVNDNNEFNLGYDLFRRMVKISTTILKKDLEIMANLGYITVSFNPGRRPIRIRCERE
jgi:hypothetical protein